MRLRLLVIATTLSACASAPPPVPPKTTPVSNPTARNAAAYSACVHSYNTRHWAELRGCYTSDVVQDEPGTGKPWVGVDEAVTHLEQFVASFPDNSSSPQLTLVNGEHVLSIVLLRGTNDGPFPSAPGPTHRRIGISMAHLVELDHDAKIKSEWILYDTLTMLAQLQLVPLPTRPRLEAVEPTRVVQAADDATEHDNVARYREAVAAYNAHDLERLRDGLADGLVWTEEPLPSDLDKPAFLGATDALWRGFSDIKRTPTSVWAAGEYVVGVGQMAGTNDGPFPVFQLDRTGKTIAATYIEVAHFAGGKRDRSWLFYNGIVIASQLGLL